MTTQGHAPVLPSGRYSQSLERGLAILKAFTPGQPILGIVEMADQLGMGRSTTHRYAITLVALGFLEQSASRKYRLAPRASDLGMVAVQSTGLYDLAAPALDEMRRQTGYTASLAVLDGAEIVYVRRAHSHLKGQAEGALAERVGSRLPAHATAAGKVLLAHLPAEELGARLDELKLARCSAATIVSEDLLLAELERVFAEGHAVSDGELRSGLAAIAMPVRDTHGVDIKGEVVAAVEVAVYAHALCGPALEDRCPVLAAAADGLADALRRKREIKRR